MENVSQLLRDESIYPSESVLAAALGSAFTAYQHFCILLKDIDIETQWRYYNACFSQKRLA
ncbi:MAG: hypothetical protein CVU86_04075 [Firmicutes bacterium HGW-Firmicutes-11]|jgi:hypothetical protein|nr:MAG: hypothetical protein CVU86_04075 [Firmicutes bacterium HGW-Firmicutes-11]